MVMVPFCECRYYSSLAASRSRLRDHATFLPKLYLRMCIDRDLQHTCSNDSGHCDTSQSTENREGQERRLFERVCDECEYLLILVEEEHDAEVPETFIGETWACDELEAFDLAKVGRRTEHVYIEELCNVVVTRVRVLLSEGGPNGCGFLLDECAFVCDGLDSVSDVIEDGDEHHGPCMLECP